VKATRYPTISTTGNVDHSRFHVRGNSRVKPQRFCMVLDQHSYQLTPDTGFVGEYWTDDLARWNAYVAREGVPHWGCGLVILDPDTGPLKLMAAMPSGEALPAGITSVNASYPPTLTELQAAYTALYTATAIREKPVYVYIISNSISTYFVGDIADEVAEFQAWLDSEGIANKLYSLWPIGSPSFQRWLHVLPDSVYRTQQHI